MGDVTNGTNGNGNGKAWMQWALLVAGMAAFLVPMQNSISDLKDRVNEIAQREKEERSLLEKRLVDHSDANAKRMETKIDTYILAADGKFNASEVNASDLRERTRALEAKLVGMNTENEGQHKWLRDAIRWVQAEADLRSRAFGGDPLPERNSDILEGIGEAPTNANGNGKH